MDIRNDVLLATKYVYFQSPPKESACLFVCRV